MVDNWPEVIQLLRWRAELQSKQLYQKAGELGVRPKGA